MKRSIILGFIALLALDTLARIIKRQTEPRVKLH